MAEVQASPMNKNAPLAFTVLRVPFFLEPNYAEDETWTESNRDRLVRKWGGQAGWEAQKQRHNLKGRGQEVGIEKFNLDRRASSTLASHRLVQWVTRTRGVAIAEALYGRLNYQHFEEGKALNNHKLLVATAEEVGVPAADAEAFLASGEGREQIEEAQKILRALGVQSIPTFIVGGDRVVGGAAHADNFVHAFREIEATGEGAPGSLFAEALQIPAEVMESTLPPPEQHPDIRPQQMAASA